MSNEVSVGSRERLWRNALIAGMSYQVDIIEALQSGKRPWFGELAPLTPHECVLVVAQLCKEWFPEMTDEKEKQALQLLTQMYGAKPRHLARYRYGH
jgi:hypothetical protein